MMAETIPRLHHCAELTLVALPTSDLPASLPVEGIVFNNSPLSRHTPKQSPTRWYSVAVPVPT